MVASNERAVKLVLSARDEASGVFASAGRNIRKSTAEIAAVQGPAVKNRFDAEERLIRQREAGILRARRTMQERERREAEIHNRLLVRDATDGPGSSGGAAYGPAIRQRFDAHTAAVRSEQARMIRSMRAQAQSSKIKEESQRALFGDGGNDKERAAMDAAAETRRDRMVEKAMERTAASRKKQAAEGREGGRKSGEHEADGFIEGLKGKFGKGSAIHEGLEILEGGGAVVGLTLAGRALAEMSETGLKFKEEMEEGKKSTGQMVDELFRGLPVIGNLYTAGRNVREMFTGDEAALRQVNEQAAKLNEEMLKIKERGLAFRDVMRDAKEALRGFADRRAMAGMEGAPAEDRAAELAAEKERRDIEERARADRERFTGPGGATLTSTIAERAQKDHDIGNAEAEYNSLTSGKLLDANAISKVQARLIKLREERDALKRTEDDITKKAGGVDKNKDAELAASKDTQAAELAARQKKRREDDVLARERVNFDANERETASKEAVAEAQARIAGNALTAELAAIKEAGEAKKRLIHEQFIEQRDSRMKALGETKEQAEAVLFPNGAKAVDDVTRDTEAATAEAKERARREQLDRERGFNKSVEQTRAETIANRLKAAGAGDDAEKVMRAEAQRQRLEDIDHAAQEELRAHAEDAKGIEARRLASTGAAGESYAASEAAAAMENQRQYLPSLNTNLSGGIGLSGALSAGAVDAANSFQGRQEKALSELAKTSGKTQKTLDDILAVLKSGGVTLTVLKTS